MKKKGALELSVSTIIVIVIGVTLLSLGLIFVKGIFDRVEEISIRSFEQANAQIGKLSDVEGLLTVSPGSIELSKGSAKDLKVIIANFEAEEIRIKAKATSRDSDILCAFADTKQPESLEYTIPSGSEANIKLIVDHSPSGTLGTKVCNVEVLNAPIGDNIDSLIINVVKPSGFFG